MDIVLDGRFAARLIAGLPRSDVDRAFKISGNHGFSWSSRRAAVHVVTGYARPVVSGESHRLIATIYVNGYRPAS